MNALSASTIQRLISYDPNTGAMTWNYRKPADFSGVGSGGAFGNAARWNARYAGQSASFVNNTAGYLEVRIFRAKLLAHRVAWACHYGAWPEQEIDHVNGVRDDNRIANLRAASHAQNSRNRAIGSNNTSGAIGVRWHKPTKKWAAEIKLDGQKRHLGLFDTFDEAVTARRKAEKSLGFHPNHGRQPKVSYLKSILPGISARKTGGSGKVTPDMPTGRGRGVLPPTQAAAPQRQFGRRSCLTNRAVESTSAEFPQQKGL